MKLTWFGNDTFRIHAAGAIVVVEGKVLPGRLERSELLGGADIVIEFEGISSTETAGWKPRAPLRLMEEGEQLRKPEIVGLGDRALVLDADGEAPLVLTAGGLPSGGRWVGQAVIVLVGEGLAERGLALLDQHQPRLIALAGSEGEVDAAFEALRDRLDGTGLVALERGLAVEA